MSETRVQAATLLCKIFLRYLDQLPNKEGILGLWLKILDILDRMMNSGQGDSLVCFSVSLLQNMTTDFSQEEAIPESVKNIILLMADGGFLVPPTQDPSKEEIWTETKKRLERFLPDLFPEIFPDASKQPAAAPASSPPSNKEPSENPTDASSGKDAEAASSPNPVDGAGDGNDGNDGNGGGHEHAHAQAS